MSVLSLVPRPRCRLCKRTHLESGTVEKIKSVTSLRIANIGSGRTYLFARGLSRLLFVVRFSRWGWFATFQSSLASVRISRASNPARHSFGEKRMTKLSVSLNQSDITPSSGFVHDSFNNLQENIGHGRQTPTLSCLRRVEFWSPCNGDRPLFIEIYDENRRFWFFQRVLQR